MPVERLSDGRRPEGIVASVQVFGGQNPTTSLAVEDVSVTRWEATIGLDASLGHLFTRFLDTKVLFLRPISRHGDEAVGCTTAWPGHETQLDGGRAHAHITPNDSVSLDLSGNNFRAGYMCTEALFALPLKPP